MAATRMQIEHRITVAVPPERIFRIYQDVQNWHVWDPDTRQAVLYGPFRAGTRGKLTPTKGNAVPMLLTSVEANRSFTVESKIPLFRMVFEHELTRNAGETVVVNRFTLSGAPAFVLERRLAKQLNTGPPVTLANLTRLAENQSAANPAEARSRYS
jgi:hypothetical protein